MAVPMSRRSLTDGVWRVEAGSIRFVDEDERLAWSSEGKRADVDAAILDGHVDGPQEPLEIVADSVELDVFRPVGERRVGAPAHDGDSHGKAPSSGEERSVGAAIPVSGRPVRLSRREAAWARLPEELALCVVEDWVTPAELAGEAEPDFVAVGLAGQRWLHAREVWLRELGAPKSDPRWRPPGLPGPRFRDRSAFVWEVAKCQK
jgi:hypothetical protein